MASRRPTAHPGRRPIHQARGATSRAAIMAQGVDPSPKLAKPSSACPRPPDPSPTFLSVGAQHVPIQAQAWPKPAFGRSEPPHFVDPSPDTDGSDPTLADPCPSVARGIGLNSADSSTESSGRYAGDPSTAEDLAHVHRLRRPRRRPPRRWRAPRGRSPRGRCRPAPVPPRPRGRPRRRGRRGCPTARRRRRPPRRRLWVRPAERAQSSGEVAARQVGHPWTTRYVRRRTEGEVRLLGPLWGSGPGRGHNAAATAGAQSRAALSTSVVARRQVMVTSHATPIPAAAPGSRTVTTRCRGRSPVAVRAGPPRSLGATNSA